MAAVVGVRSYVTHAALRHPTVPVAGLFLAFGVLNASWITRIPAVQAELGLGSMQLGLALLGLPLGAVTASLLAPRLLHDNGRSLVLVSMPVSSLALALPGAAGNMVTLTAALAAFGLATGVLDVSLNTHASHVERLLDRSIFGRLHGMWSLGAFVGAGIGTAAAAGGVSPQLQFLLTAAVVAVATVPSLTRLSSATAATQVKEDVAKGWSRHPGVISLAVVALAGLVVEVAAADWGGVFVRTVIGAGATASAAPFAVFTGLHLLVRLVGDRFVDRDARAALLTVALSVSAIGMTLLAVSTTTLFAYVSLGLVGASVSLVFPMALAGAGQIAGVPSASGVATAAGTSYIGYSVTPPLIGLIAAGTSLRVALLLPAVLAAIAAVVVRRHPC